MTKRVVVLQSNYLPWKGYFDLIATADVFVVYDSAQYTKNDWRNRNIIKTKNGLVWLTLPISTSGRFGQSIRSARITETKAVTKHFQTIAQTYGRLFGYMEIRDSLEEVFTALTGNDSLHEVNVTLLRYFSQLLRLDTEFVDDTEFTVSSEDPSVKVLEICQQLTATSYVTGPAGLNYLNLSSFRDSGIDVEVIDYSQYKPYPQLGGAEFTAGVSIIDLIANTDVERARLEMRRATHCVT